MQSLRNPHPIAALTVVWLGATLPPAATAQSTEAQVANSRGQAVLPYAEQKYRGNVGRLIWIPIPPNFPPR